MPREYMDKVKSVHEGGTFGSMGYRAPWKEEEASKMVLRTHTTAVSAAMLYEIAQNGWKSTKMFSIERVFRWVYEIPCYRVDIVLWAVGTKL